MEAEEGELKAALIGVAGDRGRVNPQWLANWLKKNKNVLVGHHRFEAVRDTHDERWRWKVVSLA